MRLVKEDNQYVFLCDYAERFTAKGAGLTWDKNNRRWRTENPRVALKLAAYADDALRAELLPEAEGLPDPDKATLTFDGQTWKYFSPYEYNRYAKDAGMRVSKVPVWHWWTEDLAIALRCYQAAAEAIPDVFVCDTETQELLRSTQARQAAAMAASRATEADVDALPSYAVPDPAKGYELLPCQVAAVLYAQNKDVVIFGDDMRIGKTPESICWSNCHREVKRILIITKKTIKLNWEREWKRWSTLGLSVGVAWGLSDWPDTDVVIANAQILGSPKDKMIVPVLLKSGKPKMKKTKTGTVPATKKVYRVRDEVAAPWDMVIVDECFLYDTPILTSIGYRPIGEIVENALDVRVASVNTTTNVVEWQRIDRWVRTLKPQFLVKVIHESGSFICTANHPVWTEREGYIRAQNLTSAHCLRMVRTTQESRAGSEVLREPVRITVENEPSGSSRKSRGDHAHEGVDIFPGMSRGSATTNAHQQSHQEPGSDREDFRETERAHVSSERREWTTDGTTEAISRCSEPADGIRDLDFIREGPVSVLTTPLQSGYSQPGSEGGYRSGRKQSRHSQVAVSRQTQDCCFECSRVVSVEIQKQRGLGRHESVCPGGPFVYNLEVSHNHNYIASGVLVSNCHDFKTIGTARQQYLQALQPKKRALLTGTLSPNGRAMEIWPALNWIDPKSFSETTRFKFAIRFADAQRGPFGWTMDGASNLDELQTILRSKYMVRRLFPDVYKEFPKRRRQLIEFPCPDDGFINEQDRLWKRYTDITVRASTVTTDIEEYREDVRDLDTDKLACFEEMSRVRHEDAIKRISFIVEHLKEVLEETPKVVCFAWHNDVVEQIAAEFPGCVSIYGKTPGNQRVAMQDRFNAMPSGLGVLGIAICEGLDMSSADVGVMAEWSWVPKDINQAEARLENPFKKTSSLIQYCAFQGSLDARMAQTLVDKEEINFNALDRELPIVSELPVVSPIGREIELPEKLEASGPVSSWGPLESLGNITDQENPSKNTGPELSSGPTLSDADCRDILIAVRTLAGVCDGAFARDSQGYNAIDAPLMHQLACRDQLTPKQGVLALKVLKKYRGQLNGQIERFYE